VRRHHNRGAKIRLFFGIRRAAKRAFFIFGFHFIRIFATDTPGKTINKTFCNDKFKMWLLFSIKFLSDSVAHYFQVELSLKTLFLLPRR
jgi:hypothetical protein